MSILKKIMMENSKTFCMFPWTHLHATPAGVAAPCCIADSCAQSDGVGSSITSNLMELVNSEKMKQLRLDMLAGVKNKECEKCYQHEDAGIKSFRDMGLNDFGKYFDEAMEQTNIDGSLKEFKMRYFDMRFNNICNFKCRTCGQEFSSQWEQENTKHSPIKFSPIPKNNNKQLLQDVLDQIEFMDAAYFAGGEPLITEEHYILLEEMIRRKRNNIKLRYNTNLSNLKFKDKDILDLWKHFASNIDVYASIDHYGQRAEYIRHGTDWAVVENNFKVAQEQNFISLQINTVLSVFNVLTIDDFYQYLINKNFYSPKSKVYTLYPMSTPHHLSAHILPESYKQRGRTSLDNTKTLLRQNNFRTAQIEHIDDAIPWLNSMDSWDQQKDYFREEINRLDKIRNENFCKTFPELSDLL